MIKSKRRAFLKKTLGGFFLINSLFIPFRLSSSSQVIKAEKSQIDQIVVWKSKRRLVLFKNRQPIKIYRIRLGFDPVGPKRKEGDGKTPEGNYLITHKNPNSAFHKSLGISYPNKSDLLLAKKNGSQPGNNIFIHGGPKNFLKHLLFDWTEGCIALTDSEINEIYDIVPVNTPIYITS